MKFTDSLKGIGSPIAFYADLIPLVGSKNAAILICQLGYWTGKQHHPEGWIYKTQEEWFFETGLTDREQRTARRDLVERGYMEERIRGIPRRLEYRLLEKPLNEIWETWMIAVDLKKRFQTLTGTYGVMLSRGMQIEEIQSQMQKFRQVIWQCYRLAEGFFDNCRQLKITPVNIVDKFREKLSQLAETLEKSKSALGADQLLREAQSNTCAWRSSVPTPSADQYLREAHLAPPPIPCPVSVAAPSKITPKTSTDTTPKSGQTEPDSLPFGGQHLKSFPDQERKEVGRELVVKAEVEVIQDTQQDCKDKVLQDPQQERKDKESIFQGQNCIFMEGKFPCGGGAENFEKTPDWVQEFEDRLRLDESLSRPEVVRLAEYRLSDCASVYRDSGRVLDSNPGDIKPEFLRFLQWYSFDRNPDLSFVRACVLKAERSPGQWGVFLNWIETFQQAQLDPSYLNTLLAAKVSSQGKRCNMEDLRLKNRLVLQNTDLSKDW